MNERRKINNDVFIGLGLAAVAAFFINETRDFRMPQAAQFPRIVLGMLFIMALILFFQGLRKTLKPELWEQDDFLLSFKVVRMPLVMFLISVGYLVLMHFTSFFISTAVFIPVCMIFLGVKKVRVILLTNVALNLFVYLVFVRVLRVMLP